jgi:short-subunit dehydrogenase
MAVSFSTAIVTGASSGIGWALALELAGRGCKLGLVARRKEKLNELVGKITANGGTSFAAPADVANRQELVSAIKGLEEQLGPVDLLVANAGVGYPTTVEPLNVEQIEEQCRVNYLGVVYALEAVLPGMLARKHGHVAAVSSLAAYKGMPGESAYCASKAAVNVFMEGLRIQLRDHGIFVTTICPGFVRTPMTAVMDTPMPFMIEADVAARRIGRALLRRKKVFNFPKRTTWLTKFGAWLPDWVWARLLRKYNEHPYKE